MAQIEKTEKPSDGRRARGEESRRRIVEAMLSQIGEGNLSPSAEEVAAQANVGLRTVFRHFDDMDSLYREISEVMATELMPIAAAPLPKGDWRELVAELVDRRARVFEKMMPFKIAADVHRHRSEFLRDEHARLGTMQRKILRDVFSLKECPAGPTFEALDLLMSFDSWRRLRLDQGLSVAQAKKTMLRASSALFESAGTAT